MGDSLGPDPQRKEGDIGVTGSGHHGPLLTSVLERVRLCLPVLLSEPHSTTYPILPGLLCVCVYMTYTEGLGWVGAKGGRIF